VMESMIAEEEGGNLGREEVETDFGRRGRREAGSGFGNC